jgi:hypothetical protein
MDMLNFIEDLKAEQKKVDHISLLNKDAAGSNYSIQNVLNGINRFPLLFKDAYGCELFLYIFSSQNLKNSMLFSYFYDVFRTNNHIRKTKKPKPFLDFINVVYGLNEDRVRKDLSNKVLGGHVNTYINFKIFFDNEISSKTN